MNALIKRAMDVSIAGTGLLILAPLVSLIALLVRIDLGRPVLFRQLRPGLHDEPFEMIKFRTMHDYRDAEGRLLPIEYRTSRFGAVLRRTRLDELPELWAILKGDMSLVGPRPIRPVFFEELAHELPSYWQRLVVRPGLTGFAQVRRGYETSMAEKLAHDLEWIADRSVLLYLRTLVSTGIRVLGQTFRGGSGSA